MYFAQTRVIRVTLIIAATVVDSTQPPTIEIRLEIRSFRRPPSDWSVPATNGLERDGDKARWNRLLWNSPTCSLFQRWESLWIIFIITSQVN